MDGVSVSLDVGIAGVDLAKAVVDVVAERRSAREEGEAGGGEEDGVDTGEHGCEEG